MLTAKNRALILCSLFEELDDSRVELFARVFVAKLDAEGVNLVRLLLVAPVLLQLRLPVTILPAT